MQILFYKLLLFMTGIYNLSWNYYLFPILLDILQVISLPTVKYYVHILYR